MMKEVSVPAVQQFEEKPKEVVADNFMQGAFSGEHYTRAKFRCPACHHRHVAQESGPGRDFPTSITATCESCQARLVIRGWQPENK
jgi:DNA-directed RNA polymerase subunit M/transcription elongation factor TFIIS